MPHLYDSNSKHNLAHFAPMVVGTVADGQLVRLEKRVVILVLVLVLVLLVLVLAIVVVGRGNNGERFIVQRGWLPCSVVPSGFLWQHPIFFSVILPRNEDALIPACLAKGIVQNEVCLFSSCLHLVAYRIVLAQ